MRHNSTVETVLGRRSPIVQDVSAGARRPTLFAALEHTQFSVRWHEIDGTRTRILQFGETDKPPLVMLHGTGSHAEAFLYNVASLAAEWRVITYDLPGHGWSSAPERSYEIAGYCRHLEGVLDWAGVGAAVLCGHSLGSWISARFAALHPESVRGLLLISPAGTLAQPPVMTALRELSREAAERPTQTAVRQRLELLVADPDCLTEEMIDLRRRIYELPDARARTERTLALQEPAARARNLLTHNELATIHHAALVVSGDQDAVVPLSAARAFADLLHSGHLHVMQGCAHWPNYERPDDFNRLALGWLRSLRLL
jgi:2-hydroxy-6-oxonona-2,4-dienedioate hydrolase